MWSFCAGTAFFRYVLNEFMSSSESGSSVVALALAPVVLGVGVSKNVVLSLERLDFFAGTGGGPLVEVRSESFFLGTTGGAFFPVFFEAGVGPAPSGPPLAWSACSKSSYTGGMDSIVEYLGKGSNVLLGNCGAGAAFWVVCLLGRAGFWAVVVFGCLNDPLDALLAVLTLAEGEGARLYGFGGGANPTSTLELYTPAAELAGVASVAGVAGVAGVAPTAGIADVLVAVGGSATDLCGLGGGANPTSTLEL